jgi:hypothetical protein
MHAYIHTYIPRHTCTHTNRAELVSFLMCQEAQRLSDTHYIKQQAHLTISLACRYVCETHHVHTYVCRRMCMCAHYQTRISLACRYVCRHTMYTHMCAYAHALYRQITHAYALYTHTHMHYTHTHTCIIQANHTCTYTGISTIFKGGAYI